MNTLPNDEPIIHLVLAKSRADFNAFTINAPKHSRIKYMFIDEAIKMEGWQHWYMSLIFISEFYKHPEWSEISANLKRCDVLLNIINKSCEP